MNSSLYFPVSLTLPIVIGVSHKKIKSTREVNLNKEDSFTGVQQKFNIKRINKEQYDIILNPFFRADVTVAKNYEEGKAVVQSMYQKVNQCLPQINDLLKLRDNSKKPFIQLRLYDKMKYEISPAVVPISIKRKGRSHSVHWDLSVDCPTILHELLHLIGLTDEYQETTQGYSKDKVTGEHTFVKNNAEIPMWDCRKVYLEDSIMGPAFSVWRNAGKDKYIVTQHICKCSDDNEACLKKNI